MIAEYVDYNGYKVMISSITSEGGVTLYLTRLIRAVSEAIVLIVQILLCSDFGYLDILMYNNNKNRVLMRIHQCILVVSKPLL